jgi:hypothetical protein
MRIDDNALAQVRRPSSYKKRRTFASEVEPMTMRERIRSGQPLGNFDGLDPGSRYNQLASLGNFAGGYTATDYLVADFEVKAANAFFRRR